MSDQITLPFEVITSVAPRTYLRNNFTPGTKLSYKIPYKDILIRGSNARKVFENIPELAESLILHGQLEPFELDVLTDGRRFLKEGERRYRAYQLLIEQGRFNPETLVEFFPSKTGTTELDRLIQQYTANGPVLKSNFKPLEIASIAYSIKHHLGEVKSNEEVADLMAVFGTISRQTVDNWITLATAPDDIKHQILTEDLNLTASLRLIKWKEREAAADREEEKSHKTKATANSLPQDPLKAELEELAAAEAQAEIYREREANRKRIEEDRLKVIANIVPVTQVALEENIGKQLAKDAVKTHLDDTIDGETGEVTGKAERNVVVFLQGTVINQEVIDTLINQEIEQVYIFKEIIPAESVFTEPVAQPEKSIYDTSRPEVEKCQKAIQGADKIEAIVTKLDVPDDVKTDIAFQVYWLQRNLEEVREWVHKNKKQNKIR